MQTEIAKLQGQRNLLIKQKAKAENEKANKQLYLENLTKARVIAQAVAEVTQNKLEYHISNLVSMALSSVFPEPYRFELRFVSRRNKTECDLIFSKNGNETDDILNNGGGGVCDIASLALRMSLWSIKKTRPVIILDEATKFLHSPDYQEKASELLKKVSDKLGIQIIMVSDQVDLIKNADNVIKIKNIKGYSIVEDSIAETISTKLRRRKIMEHK